MAAIPAELKSITPYVRRAGEVDKTGDTRAYVVSYYCRTFAMENGLKLMHKSGKPEVQQFLLGMMDELEKEKKGHADLDDTELCEAVVREYATEKLAEAEDEYMSMNANKNTARRYYAAASFFEVLATFAADKVLDEATKKSALFAKWRATEILKAIKQGRDPVPDDDELAKAGKGSGAGGDDDDDDDDGKGFFHDMPPEAPTSSVGASKFASGSDSSSEDESYKAKAKAKKRGKDKPKPKRQGSVGGISDSQKADALEYTRFAQRALQTDDFAMAKQHLESALRELGA